MMMPGDAPQYSVPASGPALPGSSASVGSKFRYITLQNQGQDRFQPASVFAGITSSPQMVLSHVTGDHRLSLLAVLICLGAIALPVLGAITLISDTNYRYWFGGFEPWTIILIFLGVSVLLFFTLSLFFKHAPPVARNEDTLYLIAGTFTCLLGLLLLMTAGWTASRINSVAGKIQGGCALGLPKAQELVLYDSVLHNIREQPWCKDLEGVDKCEGWKEEAPTSYLRYLEEEFQCAPLCDMPAPVMPNLPAQSLLELHQSTDASAEGSLRHRRSAAHVSFSPQSAVQAVEGAVETVISTLGGSSQVESGTVQTAFGAFNTAEFNKKQLLFSEGQATARLPCFNLAALRLQILAKGFVELQMFEGFALIGVAIVMSLFRALMWLLHFRHK